MRRDARSRTENQKWWENKYFLIISTSICAFILMIMWISSYVKYNNSDEISSKIRASEKIDLKTENKTNENIESTSSMIGKTVEESENNNNVIEEQNINNNKKANKENETKSKVVKNENSKSNTEDKSNSRKTTDKSINTNSDVETIALEWPIKGEILKEFSIDKLVYSETLQEWTIHNGIDIKADKSAVVCSADDGTIKSIKNDPRYGLSIIIEHANGFKTVYSNLSTAEFVVEGENVKKGQTIGTVGNSASFEVADDSHLHFEVFKDSEYVDPCIYLK